MIADGSSGTLKSTLPAITPAAWASFQTGMNPGQTGIYDFSYWDLKKQKREFVTSRSLPMTLWEMASRAGKKVGAINVPLTYPPRPVKGQIISGLLTPSMKSDFAWPQEIKERLLKKVPNYHIFNLKTIKRVNPHKDLKNFVNGMREIIENRFKAACYLLSEFDYDLFMVHFQATDVIQHVLWGYLDPGHRLYDQKKAEYVSRNFYLFLDQLINQLINHFQASQEADPLAIVISDHGFEGHKKRFELGWWLGKKGYLELNPLFFQKSFISRAVRKWSKLRGRRFQPPYFIWRKSRAFSTGRSGEGFIYLLDQKIKKQLISDLRKIKDPEIGRAIIKRVWLKEELYHGRQLGRLPDLILEPIKGYSFSGAPEYREPFHRVNPKDDFHLGKHRRQGIVIAKGPGVPSGKIKAEIIDIAPTILYYLKVPIPSNLDGQVITNLFDYGSEKK